MAQFNESDARRRLADNGQEHVFQFWNCLNDEGRTVLLGQIATIDFPLMNRLIDDWVRHEPAPETFRSIEPVPTIPIPDPARADAKAAWDAGEEALRAGRVGLLLVAGGQGTRLGFNGPKGAYPIGPITGKSLFAFHAEKIKGLQRRYGCVLPWYIMVSATNHAATEAFFRENGFFGLNEADIRFFEQRMVPCVDESGRFMLEGPGCLAMNPNGHGGTIPAVVENGIAQDARNRGVDTLSYFQVDNWAVQVGDPFFIGYHVQRKAEMSSKVHRKNSAREAVGVHCICDGEYRTIEYSELDIYPQLLETAEDGSLLHFAGNPAIHILDVGFIERVCSVYDRFPWHRAHKKIPCVDEAGALIKPATPNGYKFETFIFDALRFIEHEPVALEMNRVGHYTPIKQFDGANSVQAARAAMRAYWGGWLEAAGARVPRDASGAVTIDIEISPEFALWQGDFVKRAAGMAFPEDGAIAIAADGAFVAP
ncbi:MAG: UTP--glucose-1-phosphate uridylyltransferase [Candidatus Hydrogenedentes bacterium]|nr:UTP--glucose-1-phosphate uridylyltransferase [Candidatus Hydrogenedentota bacterium]